MTTRRRATQEAHERFNVATFIDEINRRHRASYRVVDEPNPPEAIIQSSRKTSWVEVTSAFMNQAFAEEAWSYATPGEKPRPMPNEVILGPDAQFAANFVGTIKKKLEKKSYEPFRDKYGPGYLVVSVQYPLYGRDTPRLMQREWDAATIEDRHCFRSIYLVVRRFSGYQIVLWRRLHTSD
ncbi:hypothetical protein J2X20_003439 [Pelomonas saccharophila]|uniref:Uncharacterized protein n=1 Tax=Roseateles saccharophilus TaxID=304 RepID=A0ABU1YPI9_ROSSA|nr:hypothetical protein [Roseateles saccharophilus]MDR7270781.1 hypothetical protein [Roseateles saccharophilus]